MTSRAGSATPFLILAGLMVAIRMVPDPHLVANFAVGLVVGYLLGWYAIRCTYDVERGKR